MRIRTSLALASLAVLCAMAPAEATTFTFDKDNTGGKLDVGQHANIKTTYNTETEFFTWSSTFRRDAVNGSGRLAEGAWFVISDGDMPVSNVDQYPIFYLDGLKERVSIYNYDGEVNERSYLNETLLDSFDLHVTEDTSAGERTFAFSLDATEINNKDFGDDWEGVVFGEEIGIWLHGVDELTTAYNGEELTEFTFKKQGWYDVENIPTMSDAEPVPEPGTVAALGLFAAAAASRLRKRLG